MRGNCSEFLADRNPSGQPFFLFTNLIRRISGTNDSYLQPKDVLPLRFSSAGNRLGSR